MTQLSNGQAGCSSDLLDLLRPELFRALSDGNRIALLARLALCGHSCSVGELSACCPTDLSVVSRHLAALRRAGIVRAEKRGRQVFYSLRCAELAALLRTLAEALERCCARAAAAGRADHEPIRPSEGRPS